MTQKKDTIVSNMGKNYGMTFIEYIFLGLFRKIAIILKFMEKMS